MQSLEIKGTIPAISFGGREKEVTRAARSFEAPRGSNRRIRASSLAAFGGNENEGNR